MYECLHVVLFIAIIIGLNAKNILVHSFYISCATVPYIFGLPKILLPSMTRTPWLGTGQQLLILVSEVALYN